jgi:large subunit ribosomal protein L25
MADLKLTATTRSLTGKRSRRLRAEGRLPAVVYGHHAQSQALELDRSEFQRVFSRAGRSHLLDLVVDGGRASKVLVREVQTHPRRQGPIHVDLYQVSLREKLTAEIPVILLGESPAVKRGDGDIQQPLHMVRVECLPADIPERYEVDISGLDEIDSGIRVSELRQIENVTILVDPDELVVKVAARRVTVEEEPVAAEPEAVEAEGETPAGEAPPSQEG